MSKKKETKEERSERRRKELRLALRVFRYFLPYKWAMVVALLASAVVSGTTAGTAWLIKPALDDIFIRQDGTALLYVPLAFIVLTALKGAGRYLQNWCMHYSALHVLETMRQEVLRYYCRSYEDRLMAGTSGNASVWSPKLGQMVITPSGVDWRGLNAGRPVGTGPSRGG